MRTERSIQGKKCRIYQDGEADALLIQAIDRRDLEVLDHEVEIIKERTHGITFTHVAFVVEDWNRELSPWEAPAVFGNADFGSGAAETLAFIKESLLPALEIGGKRHCYLGGYSLAGLFALWAAYQTDFFHGVAAVSPSVWFPGWKSYMESHAIRASEVYLSLGDKEERTKNAVMATVGDNIRSGYELLAGAVAVKRCKLEWNSGGHFVDSEERVAKGFAWLLNGDAR